ncbi:MAG: FAD-dependent oxidoreductase [Bacillota bacterium]|jgi:succinate dehydrogenase/fumarate reductase flavoprotein subunit
MNCESKRVDVDVLVIGSGMAGLRAAIEAKRAGQEVLLVDKSVLGRASSSIYAGGLGLEIIPKHLPYHGAGEGKKYADYFNGSIEEIFQKMVTEGVSIGWGYPYIDNQRILMTVAVDYKLRQEELRDFGVEDPYSQHFIGRPVSMGVPIIMPMVDYFKKIGGRTMIKTVLVDLIRQDDTIVGALGFEMASGRFVVITAKTTIIATGGSAQCYKRTYSPTRITGDGYALAYRAGAELWEMELVAFCNWTICEKGLPQWWMPFSYGRVSGILKNALGESFFERYAKENGWLGPNATLDPNDVMDVRYGKPLTELDHYFWRAVTMEVREGRGDEGACFMDFRHVPEERWFYENDGITAMNEMRNFDWKNKMLHIGPAAEKQAGGIWTDEYFKTSLDGLYAAGEAATGISMPFCIVSGASAGRYAAWEARETAPIVLNELTEKWINEKKAQVFAPYVSETTKAKHPRQIKQAIKDTMWEYVGPIRTEDELHYAVQELDRIEAEILPEMQARNTYELREAHEAKNMILVSKMIAKSALTRNESRGLHQRLDFPNEDNKNWLKNLLLKADKDGQMQLYTRPVHLIWSKPPQE